MNDLIVGEFVINYIQNMLRAKTTFSKIGTPADLQAVLLSGAPFHGVDHIEAEGLNAFFNLLSQYRSDASYSFTVRKSRKKKQVEISPEVAALFKERDKQERALQRLQDLYLYSDASMSEKDYMLRRQVITEAIDDINGRLGMVTRGADGSLSDEEFVRQASHLLIAKNLTSKKYIYYRGLAEAAPPEILREYMSTILDSIFVTDGRVTSIVFKNGLTHKFAWAD